MEPEHKVTNPHFWIVWNKEGPNPTKGHYSEAKALKEAHRLTTVYGKAFFVMECKAKVKGRKIKPEAAPEPTNKLKASPAMIAAAKARGIKK